MKWQGRTLKALSAAAVAGVLVVPSMVQAQEAPAVNNGKVSVTLGVDWVSQYFFRGYNILNNGIILQPYADLGFNLWKGDGPINSLSANVGIWNSFSDGHQPTGTGTRTTWTEADLYAGFTVGFLDNFSLSATYQVYKYPDIASAEQQELQFKLSYDDSELMGPFSLSPYIMFAHQLEDNVSGDDGKQYVEVGVAPSLVLLESEDYPITLTVPVVAGFSLDGYYANNNTGVNETFGYVSVAAMFSTPLSFISADYGSWTLTAGPQVIFLNTDANTGLGNGGDVVILAKVGISMAY